MPNPPKKFKLSAADLRPLAKGRGACIASDKITVGGEPVRFMERSTPRNSQDSGWVFFSGTEDEAYNRVAAHFDVYDVNTIANYDPEIIPFLSAPFDTSFERVANEGPLVPRPGSEDWKNRIVPAQWPPPGFPIIPIGRYQLTQVWELHLNLPLTKRNEDGATVLWRPGITLWINAFRNDKKQSQAERLNHLKNAMSPAATDVCERSDDGLSRLTYRLRENNVETLNTLIFNDTGHLLVTAYFDNLDDLSVVSSLVASFTATPPAKSWWQRLVN